MLSKIEKVYKVSADFEISLSYNGFSYLVIYGKHINGYFCCVPGWKYGCEMAEPSDIYYNTLKLVECGADPDEANAIADAIYDYANNGKVKGGDQD